jgi:hypothetical protein
MYRTNSLFMPEFKEKGVLHTEASVGMGDFSLNAGYTISDHLAVTASYQNLLLIELNPLNYYADIGLAVYSTKFATSSHELLGGMGYGSYESHRSFERIFSPPYERFIKTNYLRTYLQHNWYHKFYGFTFTFGNRLSYSHFNFFEDISKGKDGNNLMNHNYANDLGQIYFESVVGASIDFDQVGGFIQVGGMALLHGKPDYFIYESLVFNVGVRYRFNTNTSHSIPNQ